VVGAHLLRSQSAVDVLEHILQEFHHLGSRVVVTRFLSQIFCVAVFPAWVHLFLQWCDSAD
jgi:hypothetical protein